MLTKRNKHYVEQVETLKRKMTDTAKSTAAVIAARESKIDELERALSTERESTARERRRYQASLTSPTAASRKRLANMPQATLEHSSNKKEREALKRRSLVVEAVLKAANDAGRFDECAPRADGEDGPPSDNFKLGGFEKCMIAFVLINARESWVSRAVHMVLDNAMTPTGHDRADHHHLRPFAELDAAMQHDGGASSGKPFYLMAKHVAKKTVESIQAAWTAKNCALMRTFLGLSRSKYGALTNLVSRQFIRPTREDDEGDGGEWVTRKVMSDVEFPVFATRYSVEQVGIDVDESLGIQAGAGSRDSAVLDVKLALEHALAADIASRGGGGRCKIDLVLEGDACGGFRGVSVTKVGLRIRRENEVFPSTGYPRPIPPSVPPGPSKLSNISSSSWPTSTRETHSSSTRPPFFPRTFSTVPSPKNPEFCA